MIINLNKNIYPLSAIKSSIQAYKKLAKFYLLEKDNYYVLTLSDIDEQVKQVIKDEFCNYILSQVKT